MKKILHTPLCFFLMVPLFASACGNAANTTTSRDEAMDSMSIVTEEEPSILENVIYEKIDSVTIENLLKEAKNLTPEDNRMLFFGLKFVGIPYVAHTLEKGEKEQLVVNTRELDCTTFVETCAALTLADERDARTFEDYCQLLTQLRYRQGVCNGYPSRLHYFSQWISDNEEMGYVEEITHEGEPFSALQKVDIHYMSSHPDAYSKLKGNAQDVEIIRLQEQDLNGLEVHYIPKSRLSQGPAQLKDIKDGDILALVTNKDGLDVSHLGLAHWKNGKLHLLNASQIHKAVWTDPKTLFTYLAEKKANTGIRVVRVKH